MGKVYESITPELRDWVAQQKVFFVATAPLSGAGLVNCSPKGGDSFRVLSERQVAYEGAPKIARFHGTGEVIGQEHPEFATLARVSDSCGFAVPLYDFREPREILDAWAEKKGEEGLATYRSEKNAQSLDGLPGLP